jgi:hypothetical protein
MSRLWKRVPQTVRVRCTGRPPALLCLLAFGLTGIIVYRWGYENWTPSDPMPKYTATAYVVERPPTAADGLRIPMVYTDDDCRRAEEAANARAERYVQDHRAEWKRRTEGPCLKAHETVETARRQQTQSEAQLDAFRQQMAEAAAKPQAVGQGPDERPSPPMIDNPEWLDLERQLAELQHRRDNLLADRTPLHPAVQDVTVRIEDLQRQMATISRQIPGKLPSPSEGGEKGKDAAGRQIVEQDQAKLRELTAAVETARQACKDAEAAEKRALEAQQAGPQYAVVYAQVVEIPPTPDYGWRQLVCTTLVAGVLMAFGVGTVSAGAHVEPPVGSVAQVQAAAKAPVVGTIPADDPVPNPRKLSRRQLRRRRMLMAMGLLLIAASPVAAMLGIMGL